VLSDLEVLDSCPEPIFDEAVIQASVLCQTPIALVSFVAVDRQWFKARVGLEESETPRALSFCGHAIYEFEPLVVTDPTEDPRFAENDLVTGHHHVRFYAGVPLCADNTPLGTLCVLDHQLRTLTSVQLEGLKLLAGQLSNALDTRLRRIAQAKRERGLKLAFEAGVGVKSPQRRHRVG
jgi:GAF domain-containing protein